MAELRALLIDDEEEFVSTLAERLGIRGVSTTVAGDGNEALDVLNDVKPDVVVLDVMMPGMGGLDVLRIIKRIRPDTPVILLTGRGLTSDGIEGMRLGAYDYMVKPVNIDELLEKMSRAASGT